MPHVPNFRALPWPGGLARAHAAARGCARAGRGERNDLNIKQRFLATLPGAVLAVACWIGLSYLLGIYFRHFANFNKTYGTLGAAIALMVWLYWTGFAMLVGAELNAELAKRSSQGKLQQKHEPPTITRIGLAA